MSARYPEGQSAGEISIAECHPNVSARLRARIDRSEHNFPDSSARQRDEPPLEGRNDMHVGLGR